MVSARLTAKEAAARRREANEARLARLLDGFRDLDLDPVLISSDERFEQLTASVLCRASSCQAGPPGNEIVRARDPAPGARRRGRPERARRRRRAAVVKRREDRRPGQPTVRSRSRPQTAPAEVDRSYPATCNPHAASALFGDTVEARIDVVTSTATVDPDSVRVAAEFSPWETVGKPERTRRDAGRPRTCRRRTVSAACRAPAYPRARGRAARLRRRARYLCSNRRARERGAQVAACRLARAHRRTRGSPRRPSRIWTSSSTPWRADALTLPAVSYRVAPALLIGLLVLGGGLSSAGRRGARLSRAPESRARPSEPEAPNREPVPRSSRRSRCSRTPCGPTAPRTGRRALELVAEEVELGRDDDLARSARMLAWSEREPVVEETTGLAQRVRQNSSSRRAASTRRTAVRFWVALERTASTATTSRLSVRRCARGRASRGRPGSASQSSCSPPPSPRLAASTPASAGSYPGDATGVVVIDLSLASSNARTTLEVRTALRAADRGGRPVGLVVFSDVAYELLPPGTPRLGDAPAAAPACPRSSARRCNPWTQTFQRGTRDLRRARAREGDARARRGRQRGHPPRQRPRDGRRRRAAPRRGPCRRDRRSPIALRVYPLGPSSDARRIFGGLLEERLRRPSRPERMPSPWRARVTPARRGRSTDPRAGFSSPSSPFTSGSRGSAGATEAREGRASRRHLTRRAGLAGGALACFAVSVVLFLLAADVARWRDALSGQATSTIGSRLNRTRRGSPTPSLPSTAARALLGVQDDVELPARGARLCECTPGGAHRLRSRGRAPRNEAQARLRGNRRRRRRPVRRSRAAGLLGVLGLAGSCRRHRIGRPFSRPHSPISSSRSPSIPGTATRSSTSSSRSSAGADRPRGGGRRSEAVARRGRGHAGAGAGEPGSGY